MTKYNTNIDAEDWAGLEPAPSTRDSTHLHTKWFPINKKLAVPGTPEDLFVVTPMRATVNLVENPSFESGDPPTGFTAIGATLAQDAVTFLYGANSMLITPDDVVAGEGAYWETTPIPARQNNKIPLSISCYFRDAAGSGDPVRVRLVSQSKTPFAGGTENFLNGSTVNLSTSWQRSILSVELDTTDNYIVQLVTATQHGTAFNVDGFQVETAQSVTDYCDGDQNVYCSWDGAKNASTSRRIKSIGSIRQLTLHTDRAIYICYDGEANATNGRYVGLDTSWWIDHPVYLLKNISFVNVLPGEFPQVTGEIWGI